MSLPDFKGLEVGGHFRPHYADYVQMDKTSGGSTQIIHSADVAPWPFENEVFDVVYASHIVEHITRKRVKTFFDESYRVLKHGGVIKISTPDFAKVTKAYIESGDIDCRFMGGDAAGDPLSHVLYGEEAEHLRHYMMFDRRLMSSYLTNAGFVDITYAEFNPRYLETEFINVFKRAPYEVRCQYEMYCEGRKV